MEPKARVILTVQSIVNTSVARAWKYWTTPEDIVRWNVPSDFWHTTHARNELHAGGRFVYRMESADGSSEFDFSGTYDYVTYCRQISFTIGDGRKVQVCFSGRGNRTEVTETFETENSNPVEEQRKGWQSILDHFKNYAEKASRETRH
jgi:uncharacterized protein YndB with AHSA1/START domain